MIHTTTILTRADGFGREIENPVEHLADGDDAELSDLRWGPNVSSQTVFHLHGTLPLFDSGIEVVKEQHSDEGYLLENIGTTLDAGEYPIFVAAGYGKQKLEQIRHNRYLSHCFDHLSRLDGSLVSHPAPVLASSVADLAPKKQMNP